MFAGGWLLVIILLSSLIPGLIIFSLEEDRHVFRSVLNMSGALLKIILVLIMDVGILFGQSYEVRLRLLVDIELVLHADPLSALFCTLSSVLWLLTTLYAIGYLENSPNRSHFFGFFSLCVSVTTGIALAGNLITFLLFYEMLTLTTYPLIIHRGTEQALKAGSHYLIYTFSGGSIFLFSVIWLQTLTGPIDFMAGGFSPALIQAYPTQMTILFLFLFIGVGVKAALIPLHGWLPAAMIAPAPVSALLHAVAVVKAGAFGIIRIVLDVYGIKNMQSLNLLPILGFAAAATILYGSVKALQQDDLKRRLAYSTVSQVSYIALGVSMADQSAALIGGLVHLVHQGIMKITLFFCAGNLAETLGIHKVSQMKGVAKRMPLTMLAFSVGAFGMIGVPPTAGFISKWYLGIGSLESQAWWVLAVLVISSFLNALYFLPIIIKSWFQERDQPYPDEKQFDTFETHWMLLIPPLVTACIILIIGLVANSEFSPLSWVRFIVEDYLLQ